MMYATRSVRCLLLLCAAAVVGGTAAIAEPKRISFKDLPDPQALDFHDPFSAMGARNLSELKTVVQLRERLAAGAVEPANRPRLEARVAEATASLTANGYDIEALMEQRWDIAKKRRDARLATNPAIAGAEVTMSGYLIPAPPLEDGTPIGYLVPAVGLCSHLPTPPPNQLVRVSLAKTALPAVTLYTPVRIGGMLRVEASDRSIFVLDGFVRMLSMWTLHAREAVVAADTRSMVAITEWGNPLRSPSRGGVDGSHSTQK
jgi:hypothetical protein